MARDSCGGCIGASFDCRFQCAGCVDFSNWEIGLEEKCNNLLHASKEVLALNEDINHDEEHYALDLLCRSIEAEEKTDLPAPPQACA